MNTDRNPAQDEGYRAVALRGEPHQIKFPNICPACLQPAQVPVLIEKVWHYGDDEGEDRRVTGACMPLFCTRCAQAHAAELGPAPSTFLARLKEGWTFALIAGLNIWLLTVIGPGMVKLMIREWNSWMAILPMAVICLFGGLAAWAIAHGMNTTRWLACRPQTSITQCLDFSDDRSKMFEPTWRKFSFRHGKYGKALVDLNRSLVWDQYGQHARKARGKRTVAFAMMGIVLGLVLVWGLVNDMAPSWAETVREYLKP